jgi:hypothetical protein
LVSYPEISWNQLLLELKELWSIFNASKVFATA